MFIVKILCLFYIRHQIIELSGRRIRLDPTVLDVAVLVTRVGNGRRASESVGTSFGCCESATSLGSDVHPLASADGQMSRLAGSKDEVIAKRIRGVSGQRRQDVDTIAALSTF